LGGGRGVGRQRGASRPEPALRRRAKAALVISIGRDPLFGPDFTRSIEGVGVVVEAVQGEDHRLHLALTVAARQPFAQRQVLAVGGNEASLGQVRHGLLAGGRARRADAGEPDFLVGRRRAADEQQQGRNHTDTGRVGRDLQPAAPHPD